MSRLIYIFLFVAATLSCCTPSAKVGGYSSNSEESYVVVKQEKSDSVEKYDILKDMYRFEDSCQLKVQRLLDAKYDYCLSLYNPDTIHTTKELAALELINKMCGMRSISHSDWQWMLACDNAFDEYRLNVGRDEPISIILEEVNKIITPFSDSGIISLMDRSVYPWQSIMLYQMMNGYREIIINENDMQLQNKIFIELKEWTKFCDATYDFYADYGCAWGQNGREYFFNVGLSRASLYSVRKAQLEIERNIILNNEAYKLKNPVIKSSKWKTKLDSIANINTADVYGYEDYNLKNPSEIAQAISTSFTTWHKARIDVMKCLEKNKAKSYDNMTSDIHNDLFSWLEPEQY